MSTGPSTAGCSAIWPKGCSTLPAGHLGWGDFDVALRTTIPSGSATRHFEISRRRESAPDEWEEFSERLRAKALRILDVRGPDGS